MKKIKWWLLDKFSLLKVKIEGLPKLAIEIVGCIAFVLLIFIFGYTVGTVSGNHADVIVLPESITNHPPTVPTVVKSISLANGQKIEWIQK